MQFYTNSNSNRQSVVHDVLYLCGLPTVSASFSSYSLHDITRNINNAYLDITSVIWSSAAGWQYDDSNATDFPVATATLVHNQQDYTLPTTTLRIQRVEVKDSGGIYHPVQQIDIHDLKGVATSEFMGSGGMPLYYDLVGNSLFFYPTPISGAGGTTLSSGVKIYFDRTPTLFTTNGTTASTTSPGFASPFHRYLSYSAAVDYVQDKATQDRLVAIKERLKQGLIQFYSKRNVERKSNIRINKNIKRYI